MVYTQNETSADQSLKIPIQAVDDLGATYILVVGSLKLDSLVEEILQDREDTVTFQTALQARQKLEVELHGAPLAQPDLLLDLGGRLGQEIIDNAAGGLGLRGRWLVLPAILHARVEAIITSTVGGASGCGRRLVRKGVDDQDDGGGERGLEGLLDGELQDQVDEVCAQPLVVVVVGQEVRDPVDLLLDAAEGVVGEVDDLLAQARRDWGLVAAARAPLVAVGLLVVVILCMAGEGQCLKKGHVRITCESAWDKRQGVGRELQLAAYPCIASFLDCTLLRRPVCGRSRPCLKLTTCNWIDRRIGDEGVVDIEKYRGKFRDVSSESGTRAVCWTVS